MNAANSDFICECEYVCVAGEDSLVSLLTGIGVMNEEDITEREGGCVAESYFEMLEAHPVNRRL